MWNSDRILERINKTIIKPHLKKGLDSQFSARFNSEFSHLWELYNELYGHNFDCLYQLEELTQMMIRMRIKCPDDYKVTDRFPKSGNRWFTERKSVGMMLYVDLFNIDINGIREKIGYFEDLGVNTLHLMPLFEAPAGDSDGGYAVSNYQKVRADLGTMEELSSLAESLKSRGIFLILDFILNHTSSEHEWAEKALKGNTEYQNYYFMFDTREEADTYDSNLREIFPTVRKGSFTYIEECGKWVWTTFNSYQWDLNYTNPDVFRAMSEQMLFLFNHGTDVLRLDALAFTWKEKGTICENLPKAHILIKAFRSVAKITAPGLSFLSEAIVHPDEVLSYISEDECELSYNPLLMATGWEALATRDTSLLKKTFSPRFSIPENCRWVNYIRCHDDIGWTFCNEDAASLQINGYDHRRFLNAFYSGRFPGSFAKGVPFQENVETGDARISGTMASLAGLEIALIENNREEIDLAIKRIKMLFAFNLSLPGLPLIYSGDELAMINDYSYMTKDEHSEDSRWVHRNPFPWGKVKELKSDNNPSEEVYSFLKQMIRLRSETIEIEGSLKLINISSNNLLAFKLQKKKESLIILINFTERITPVDMNTLRIYGGFFQFRDLISKKEYHEKLKIDPYQVLWLKGVST